MGLLSLLPKAAKTRLLLQGVEYAFTELEAKHVGTLLNEAMDVRIGSETSNKVQKQLAKWLRQVADEVER